MDKESVILHLHTHRGVILFGVLVTIIILTTLVTSGFEQLSSQKKILNRQAVSMELESAADQVINLTLNKMVAERDTGNLNSTDKPGLNNTTVSVTVEEEASLPGVPQGYSLKVGGDNEFKQRLYQIETEVKYGGRTRHFTQGAFMITP